MQPPKNNVLDRLRGGLIVSCQAKAGEPFDSPAFLLEMAKAAALGGAAGIRTGGPEVVRTIAAHLDLPVIGLWKVDSAPDEPYITPTRESIRAVARAGADIIAVDATARARAGADARQRIAWAKETGKLCMADVATLAEGLAAARAGADLISTTLSGYTPETAHRPDEPDDELLRNLVAQLDLPVILEGRVWTWEQAAQGIAAGAFAVVVGTAITRPHIVTQRFAQAVAGARPGGRAVHPAADRRADERETDERRSER